MAYESLHFTYFTIKINQSWIGKYTIPAPMDDVMGSLDEAIRLGPWSPCSILELVGSAVGKGMGRGISLSLSIYIYIHIH